MRYYDWLRLCRIFEGEVTPQNFVRSYTAYSIAAYFEREQEDIEARDRIALYIDGTPLAKAQEYVRVLVDQIEAFTAELKNI